MPSRCLIDSARRRRAAGAALAAEKREEAAHLLVVPASSRPDVLRLFRRWGLVAGGFGRCFPGRFGPAARLEFVCFFPGPRSYARLKILLFRCSRRWSFRALLLVDPCCSHAVCFRCLPSLKQQRAKRRWEQHTSNRDSDQREQQEQEEQQLQQQQKQQESTGSKAAGGDS